MATPLPLIPAEEKVPPPTPSLSNQNPNNYEWETAINSMHVVILLLTTEDNNIGLYALIKVWCTVQYHSNLHVGYE